MSTTDTFADDLLWEMLTLSPDLAAELGLGEVSGRSLARGRLLDYSDDAGARRRSLMDERRHAFARLAAPASPDDRTTHRVLSYLLEDGAFGLYAGAGGRDFPEIPFPVNHLSGWHPSMVMMLVRDHQVRTADDADEYLQRLDAIPDAIDGVIQALAARASEGVVAPRSTLALSLAEIEAFAADPPAANPLVASFRDKVDRALGAAAASSWAARAEAAWTTAIAPAYVRLIGAIGGQLTRAGDEDGGFWRLPRGEAWYAWLLRSHTTTDLTPDAVHEIGLEEIARVQARITGEFAALGIRGADISELYAAISGPDHAAFGGRPVSRAEALDETRALIDRLARASAPLFERLPRAGVEVDLVAPNSEASQHSQYTPPALGSGRPGRFSLNLKSTLERPGWELPVLCAHEATPGHHTQLALAQELPLCDFRRTVVFTAYIEGWAKYAESLLDHELMDDPYVRLGRLRGELYSSVNLVLDTGVHARRWPRAQAATFFREQTGVPVAFAESIADRCLVWPAQMTAYKVGMLKLNDLRARMAARPGGPKAFHSAVLGRGALPLAILDEAVPHADLQGAGA